ncbi:hypothetical protein ABPG72_010836 [Tetrahymena utriculariae]
MLSEPVYISIPTVIISAVLIFPIWNFYRRKERQQYKARSPLLSINCLIFELICFWVIVVSSIINYDEEYPTQMNVTQWSCPNDNSVESLNRYELSNKFFIAIFTASKNSQILLFIARCFRITCAYNIQWERYQWLTKFFTNQKRVLIFIYFLWAAVFLTIFFQPYLSPFSFWMIEIYSSNTLRNIFSCIFTIYFTFCVIALLYCLYKIDITDSRFKIKYDIYLIVSCFIFTNLFFFASQKIPCSNSTDYYFLGINPFFWIVILLDIWVVLAVGYTVVYVDAKLKDENYVLMHETHIGNVKGFMCYKNQYDSKQIFLLYLSNLSDIENNHNSFYRQISQEYLTNAPLIYELYIDILTIDINIINSDSGFNILQAQNNANHGETQIKKKFQALISDYFTPTKIDRYLGQIYGIDQQCRGIMEQMQKNDVSNISIPNQLISSIMVQTEAYINEFFESFKETSSYHFMSRIYAHNSILSERLISFKLIS